MISATLSLITGNNLAADAPTTMAAGCCSIDHLINNNWSDAGLPTDPALPVRTIPISTFGGLANDKLDDSDALDQAIQLATEDKQTVITLKRGEYLISRRIHLPSQVTLKGEGPGKTTVKIKNTGDGFATKHPKPGNWLPIISGANKGSRTLTLESTDGISSGDFIELVQNNDADLMYSQDRWNVSWAANAVGQINLVTDVRQNEVDIADDLNITFSSAHSPRLRQVPMTTWVGLENLTIDGRDAKVTNTAATIEFRYAAYFSVRNVKSLWTDRQHVLLMNAYRGQVIQSEFKYSHSHAGGGRGYGVMLARHTSKCLIENNIFSHLRHSLLLNTGANGNVIAYNTSRNPKWIHMGIPADISVHGHYPFSNLFEGNNVHKIHISDYWGPAGPANVYFRNCVREAGISYGDHSHRQAIIANELPWNNKQNLILHSDTSEILDTVVLANLTGNLKRFRSFDVKLDLPSSMYRAVSEDSPPLFGPDGIGDCNSYLVSG